jgi:hypothetical protein
VNSHVTNRHIVTVGNDGAGRQLPDVPRKRTSDHAEEQLAPAGRLVRYFHRLEPVCSTSAAFRQYLKRSAALNVAQLSPLPENSRSVDTQRVRRHMMIDRRSLPISRETRLRSDPACATIVCRTCLLWRVCEQSTKETYSSDQRSGGRGSRR